MAVTLFEIYVRWLLYCYIAIFRVANRKRKIINSTNYVAYSQIPSNKFNGKYICTLVRNSRYFCGMRCLKYRLGLGNIYDFASADYRSAPLLIISATLLCTFSFIPPFLCLAIQAFRVFSYLRHITHYSLTRSL